MYSASDLPALPALPGCRALARIGRVRITCTPNAFAPHQRWVGEAPSGLSLARTAQHICDLTNTHRYFRGHGWARINGDPIPYEAWAHVYTMDGDCVEMGILPRGGGGGFLNQFLKIVVGIIGAIVSFFVPAAWVPLVGAITLGLMMVVDLIAPIQPPKMSMPSLAQNDFSSAPTYNLNSSSNDMRAGQPVQVIFGRHLVAPARIMDDVTELVGHDEYFNFRAVVGIGPLHVEDIRIGETELEKFRGVTLQQTYGRPGDPPITIFPTVAYQDALQVQLSTRDSEGTPLAEDAWWITRTTPPNVDRITVDVVASGGLYGMDDNANKYPISVPVQIRYRVAGSEGPWQYLGGEVPEQSVSLAAAWVPPVPGYWERYYDYYEETNVNKYIEEIPGYYSTRWAVIVLSAYNQVQVVYGAMGGDRPGASGSIIAAVHVTGASIDQIEQPPHVVESGIVATQSGDLTVRFTSGRIAMAESTYSLVGISGDPGRTVRATYGSAVAHGPRYDVQTRRASLESVSSRYTDKVYWTALRCFDSTRPANRIPVPTAEIGLRILASSQFQSRLGMVTCIASSILPEWDAAAGAWVERITRNPGAAFVAALRGPGNRRPRADSVIEWESIQKWSEFCETYGYTCDMVREVRASLWDVLADICATGRASPTITAEGKWGVVWAAKKPGMPTAWITPRNARDIETRHTYVKDFDGIKCKFRNEATRWAEDEIVVYRPGLNADTARDIDQSMEFFGTTKEPMVAVRAAWHMQRALLGPAKHSVTLPLEYVLVSKGQKVRFVSPELLFGIGAATAKKILLDAEGDITGIVLDDILPMDSDAPYAMAVRLSNGTERLYTGSSRDGRTFTFDKPELMPTPAMERGDLCMVGPYEKVGRECIVESVVPQEDFTGRVTMVDYYDGEYENDGGPWPEYDPSITFPGRPSYARPDAPTVLSVRSDEWALAPAPGGGTIPRIFVEYTAGGFPVQMQIKKSTSSQWLSALTLQPGETFAYIQGVEELVQYDIRLRCVDRETGLASDWAIIPGHLVIGRTTPPPPPDAVMLDGYILRIQQTNRPLDLVGHEVWMGMDEDDTFDMALKLTRPITSTGTFDLAPWAGRARAVFVRSIDEIGLTSTLVRVAINLGDVIPQNLVFERRERPLLWPGSIEGGYVLESGALTAQESTWLWPLDDDAPLWPLDDAAPLWPSGTADILRYTWRVEIPRAYAGAGIVVLPDVVSGRMTALEMRIWIDRPLWPLDDDAPLWPLDDAAPLWPLPFVGEWQPLPDRYVTPGGETLEFRITFSGASAALLQDIRTIIDVEDKEYSVGDVVIPPEGMHIPLPPRTFRAVTVITFGLQAMAGLTASSVFYLPGTALEGEDGYLTHSPRIIARDVTQQPASASVDVRMKGY